MGNDHRKNADGASLKKIGKYSAVFVYQILAMCKN
jgi:hypothetical protein